MTLQTQRVWTLEQVRAFIEGGEAVDFAGGNQEGAHTLVRRTLVRLEYHARPHSRPARPQFHRTDSKILLLQESDGPLLCAKRRQAKMASLSTPIPTPPTVQSSSPFRLFSVLD